MPAEEGRDEVCNDLAATKDYIDEQVTADADRQDIETLVAWRDAIQGVLGSTKTALALIEQELARQLESGARQIGNRVYARRRDYKERFEHVNIRLAVAEAAREKAIDPATGEVDHRLASELALAMFAGLYVSPSTRAKVTALDALGNRDDFMHREFTGYKLSVTELDE